MPLARDRPGPPRSTIVISPESVVELSKSVLLPVECDTLVPAPKEDLAGVKPAKSLPCGQKLNCWKAFSKHCQIKHCTTRRRPNGGGVHHVCRLAKCNAKLQLTLTALKSHIEHSHLKHLPLPCPFTRCREKGFPGSGQEPTLLTFSRPQDLVRHLETQHGDLIGQAVDVDSNILLHRYEPLSPRKSLAKPPPLPLSGSNGIRLGGLFVEAIVVRPTPHLVELISNESTHLPSRHLPKRVPRSRMLRHPTSIGTHRTPSTNHNSEYEFADFPDVEYHRETNILTPPGILDPPWFAVRPVRDGFLHRDLVRPLPPANPPMDAPPPRASIFYDALRRQVMEEYALGRDRTTNS
ncbi:hypothetical protein C8R46DRAFT_445229 [Mycena filopes]|nr:hypothetical protein C8R46DRAFT_445229 [Mycena filopes]